MPAMIMIDDLMAHLPSVHLMTPGPSFMRTFISLSPSFTFRPNGSCYIPRPCLFEIERAFTSAILRITHTKSRPAFERLGSLWSR